MTAYQVIKLNGEKENFSSKKVYQSAMKAGAPAFLAKNIATEIEKEVYNGIKTTEIFKKVKDRLKKEDPQISLRFNLKEGMKKLGPAGFVFEDYVRKVLSRSGMKVKGNKILSGKCCSYEIDFLAEKEETTYIGECKYRNNHGDKIDINVCLKSFAILDDIKSAKHFNADLNFFIVTNSKFTEQAIKYANCKGIKLLGWNYPKNDGLEILITKNKLYPITILPSFRGYCAEIFKKEGIMLVDEILSMDVVKFSKKVNIPEKQLESLKREAQILLK
jgi:Holliday junction resolvase-like predicted endonuclease